MLNRVTLIGRLGKDPEMRTTTSGMAVASFSLATHERVKGEEETEWHNIVCFDRKAEIASDHLGRGSLVVIEGKLQTRSWEDRQTGEKKYRTEIICRGMRMLPSGSREKE